MTVGNIKLPLIVDDLQRIQLRQQQQHQQQQGLVNLETSIKNLEMHLKAFNRSGTNAMLDTNGYIDDSLLDSKYDKRKSVRLPTIMEGVDGQTITTTVPAAPPRNWQDDPDDSLMDLDLDSFLLANEVSTKDKSVSAVPKMGTSNVVTSFDDSLVSNKFIENNYRCHKYVNSCPDDPYNVESISEDHHQPSIDKSLAFYLKKCEDQVHYQNTKDILEEIREKLNGLLVGSTTPPVNSNPFIESDNLPKSSVQMQNNIQSLKGDLDNYLSLMNKSNEMEIKQFCTGLSKNYKLLAIQNALENRGRLAKCADSSCSNYEAPAATDIQYEPIAIKNGQSSYREREESQFDTVYVRDGFSFGYKSKDPFHLDFSPPTSASSTQDRCKPDMSNFKLQQKLKNSPCSSCEEMILNSFSESGGNSSDPSDDHLYDQRILMSQMHQNLAMQQHRFPGIGNGGGSIINGIGIPIVSPVDDKEAILDWHKNKPSIWELYYGTNRMMSQTILKKVKGHNSIMSYVSNIF